MTATALDEAPPKEATYRPHLIHFNERDAVTFNVIDSPDADAARGDFAGPMPGVVRPVLEWRTDLS